MNCTYCEDRLSDYLENMLDASERAVVETHLKSCSACSQLFGDVRQVMGWGRELPAQLPPPWLSARIIAGTPRTVRVTWKDWWTGVWTGIREPRVALSLMTSVVMLGWMANIVGISLSDVAMVRQPSAVYSRMEGWANRIYGDAVRSYYSSPLVNSIQRELHSRLEPYRENS
jgi:predicted anti-sigma-YlaC factor YlaD